MRRKRAALLAGLAATVIAAAGLAFLNPASSNAAVAPGTWYTVTSDHSGLAWDISGQSTQPGAELVQQNASGAESQQFRFLDAGDGYYAIQVRHSEMVLDVWEWNADNGATIAQYDDVGGTNQQWSVTEHDDGTHSFINRFSEKALDLWDWSTTPGDRISQYDSTGSAVQRWHLEPAGQGPTDPEPTDPEPTDPGPGDPGPGDCEASPSQPAGLGGDLGTHDPALWAGCAGEDWYVFATGDGRIGDGNIPVRRSTDEGRSWQSIGTIWNTKPAWISQEIPGVDNLWAPEIHYDASQDRYYLYYSASTFGAQRSLIGLATNDSLGASGWVDEGIVFQSYEGDPYNAIDPNIIVDGSGTHWMVYGSWWEGIHILELDWPSGKPADGAQPIRLATKGGGIEGASMTRHGDYYYLFVSLGQCCEGADSTYQIAVGRSASPTGPFLDANGVDMRDGGGTVVLGSHGNYVATGGQSIHRGLMAYHSYHQNGSFSLGIEQIEWSASGWPVLNGG
ncbi:family 43 glycosylhydrolase [Glycomyces xiaoerkulensis]|uniref:family 43 glycosylhydrolase n=1 Tax=Glycomyces xiaoerkulensis TaxID=2038139 RepID=UPI000C266E54|nr:family 43 glycosylhydrolase [Glycomyces xiaoerkulensis]